MVATSDGSNHVDYDTHKSPDEARDLDGPVSEDLSGQSERIIVGDVVGNNGQGEEDETEFSKTANWSQNSTDQTTDGAIVIVVGIRPLRNNCTCNHAGSAYRQI